MSKREGEGEPQPRKVRCGPCGGSGRLRTSTYTLVRGEMRERQHDTPCPDCGGRGYDIVID